MLTLIEDYTMYTYIEISRDTPKIYILFMVSCMNLEI